MTALVCPFTVLSNSPDSQSQIFTVESSLAEAKTVQVGWNAIRVIGARWDVSVCRAVRGKNGPEEDEAEERDEVDNSASRDAFRASRSIFCPVSLLPHSLLFPLSSLPLLSMFNLILLVHRTPSLDLVLLCILFPAQQALDW
jgi:hypothetical protein